MTPDDLLERIEDLDNYTDEEEYHCKEDRLMAEVLETIANGREHAEKLAQMMFDSYENYDGIRWFRS